MAFVGYRDYTDVKRFEIKSFTEDVKAMENFIAKIEASSNQDGGDEIDWPEDVTGGFK